MLHGTPCLLCCSPEGEPEPLSLYAMQEGIPRPECGSRGTSDLGMHLVVRVGMLQMPRLICQAEGLGVGGSPA